MAVGGFRVEIQKDAQQPRTIICRYDPTEPGMYAIQVMWSGINIPGSPFLVQICSTRSELEQAQRKSRAFPASVERLCDDWFSILLTSSYSQRFGTFALTFVNNNNRFVFQPIAVETQGPLIESARDLLKPCPHWRLRRIRRLWSPVWTGLKRFRQTHCCAFCSGDDRESSFLFHWGCWICRAWKCWTKKKTKYWKSSAGKWRTKSD